MTNLFICKRTVGYPHYIYEELAPINCLDVIIDTLKWYEERQGVIHTDTGVLVGNCALPASKTLELLKILKLIE